MVLWIIGMSGSGKTTIATQVVDRIREKHNNVILLDGDLIRDVFGNDVDHSIEGRLRNAERLSHLTKFISDQNVHVVAAVLSIFPEWRRWNSTNISNYNEVYVKASMETLLRRDIKDLYSKALSKEIKNVVGVDIPFPDPENPDLVIDNNQDRDDFDEIIGSILMMAEVRKIL
jgi:cytidine diphosphoramidate kinase